MTIQAIYRDGAFYPNEPLNLPENTPAQVVVVSWPEQLTPEQLLAMRPNSPRFTSQELRERIAKYGVSVGTLPPDFSREDIYSEHD